MKEKRKGSIQMLGSHAECYLLEASKTVDGHLCPSWLLCGVVFSHFVGVEMLLGCSLEAPPSGE